MYTDWFLSFRYDLSHLSAFGVNFSILHFSKRIVVSTTSKAADISIITTPAICPLSAASTHESCIENIAVVVLCKLLYA